MRAAKPGKSRTSSGFVRGSLSPVNAVQPLSEICRVRELTELAVVYEVDSDFDLSAYDVAYSRRHQAIEGGFIYALARIAFYKHFPELQRTWQAPDVGCQNSLGGAQKA